MEVKPKNYRCSACGHEQYANKYCRKCGDSSFLRIRAIEPRNLNMSRDELSSAIAFAVLGERSRQDEKWGVQRHGMGTWLKILVEEVREVAQAMQQDMNCAKDSDADDLYTELIQVAAVAQAIAEQVLEQGVPK